MKRPKCGSAQTKVEVVQTSSKTNHVSILRRIGRFILIVCTLGLWDLVPMRKEHTSYNLKKIGVCQNCGETWEVE